MSQERGTTYPNTMALEVLRNGNTGRGNKGIEGCSTPFPLEAPDAYPFDFGRPLILHSVPVLPPPSSLASTVWSSHEPWPQGISLGGPDAIVKPGGRQR